MYNCEAVSYCTFVEPPVVHMRPVMMGWLNKPVKIACHIESLVPFSALWFKDGVPLTTAKKYE
jgi:hypothetical protein